MSVILILLMAVGGVSEAGERDSLCEEMRGQFRDAVMSEIITEGEYRQLMGRCREWEGKRDK